MLTFPEKNIERLRDEKRKMVKEEAERKRKVLDDLKEQVPST